MKIYRSRIHNMHVTVLKKGNGLGLPISTSGGSVFIAEATPNKEAYTSYGSRYCWCWEKSQKFLTKAVNRPSDSAAKFLPTHVKIKTSSSVAPYDLIVHLLSASASALWCRSVRPVEDSILWKPRFYAPLLYWASSSIVVNIPDTPMTVHTCWNMYIAFLLQIELIIIVCGQGAWRKWGAWGFVGAREIANCWELRLRCEVVSQVEGVDELDRTNN